MADLYAPIMRKTGKLAGPAGPLPYAVANWSDEALRNLDGVDPSFGLSGLAYWPVVMTDPTFDPATEALTDDVTLSSPDPETFTVPGTRGKRPLTADEIAALNPVPEKVTNFQARSIMLRTPYGDGTVSLFTRVDTDLRAAIEATKDLPDLDPQKVEVATQWQAWEQANDYFRNGGVTQLLAARYDVSPEAADDLFRQASKIDA